MKKTLVLTLAAAALATSAFAADPPAAPASTPASSTAAATTMRTPTSASTHATTPATPSLYTQAQTKLKADGLYNGPLNGERTIATVHAIRQFQTQHHLTASGHLDTRTRQALGI